ncbi:sugar transferase [Bordetella avium]|uniref:Exopolysaccharide biosynthesis glycosyl transferase n=1 Tax=Bordetella avium (strain 197N) TaxID=360910 RepID=Q2KUH2_BORA1|nr:sugar transferase [Bordetella avium]AZY50416.1 sugar transferase [Bordetella avium]AZY53812.1 sugar transferase [Bordetella avium]RIQ15415.1 sugar transferase [Bordetella avium]RIQ19778.1 sugar transferase [Bordetella avium]RIQ34359.1 sugar transferase [Bordetella avium]
MRRILALVLLLLLSPLLVLLALLVLCAHGWPVLFTQERAGLHGRPFRLYKFRSMRTPSYPGESDEARLTRFGRWLRRTSLDELPGLWNVLTGDMNFIGPRPLPTVYVARCTPEQRRRYALRPGITGWAQVHGRNALDWESRFRLDCWYVDHASWCVDLRILWLTLRVVLTGAGVSAPGQATCAEFLPDKDGRS